MKLTRVVSCLPALGALVLALNWPLVPASAAEASSPPAAQQRAAALKILSAAERSYEDAPALALSFSQVLPKGQRHDAYFEVTKANNEPVKGAWVLAESGRVLYFPGVSPDTEYRIAVRPGLAAVDGATLGEASTHTVKTRPIVPGASFASQGFLLPGELSEGLPVVTVNVDRVTVDYFRVKPEDFPALYAANSGYYSGKSWHEHEGRSTTWGIKQLKPAMSLVYTGVYDLAPAANKRTKAHLPVRDLPVLRQPGVYLAVMRGVGEYADAYSSTFFFVTDLGLHVRLYDGEAEFIVSSLKSGKGVAGASLKLMDKQGKSLFSGTSDADGVLRYSGDIKDAVYLQAEQSGSLSLLSLKGVGLNLADFELGERASRPAELFLYSPRRIYRAGETVTLSGLLRDSDGKPITATPLKASLLKPDDEEAEAFTWQAKELGDTQAGYYETEIVLPADAERGAWKLVVHQGDEEEIGRFEFVIDDFLPERLRIDLPEDGPTVTPADGLSVPVKSAYLYGSPAAGNTLTVNGSLASEGRLFPNDRRYKDFFFGNADASDYVQNLAFDEQKLDKDGAATVEVDAAWEDLRSPALLKLQIAVQEAGGRPVNRTYKRQIWPAKALVGIRQSFSGEYIEPGLLKFDVIKLDMAGKPQAAKDVQVNLIKEDRDYYWAYDDSQGWHWKYSKETYTRETRQLSLGADKPTSLAFQLDYGHYTLEVLDTETGIVTSQRFRVGWSYWDEEASEGGAARPEQVLLKLDKPAYRPGETAKLSLRPPKDGEALVYVEGNGRLWSRRLPVSAKGTELAIPVDPSWDSHNLYITAVVLRPGDQAEQVAPARAVGVLPLRLDRSERKLDLHIQAPEKAVPNSKLKVQLSLAKPPSGPVWVTLSAVDVGILSLLKHEEPDPHAWFFAQRRYATEAYDNYDKLIDLADGKAARLLYGGDAALDTLSLEAQAKPLVVAKFHAPVRFDAEGKTSVTLDLPDFNGRLRLTAVAFGAERFATAATETQVAAPLVAELNMPRFLASGDKSNLTLELDNLSGGELNLEVKLAASSPLKLQQGIRQLKLKKAERQNLRFPVEAGWAYDTATLSLDIKGGPADLHRSWQLMVRPAQPALVRKSAAQVAPGGRYQADAKLLEGLVPETVRSYLALGALPPFNAREHLDGLLRYPYGCAEQTTSSAFPLVFADEATQEKLDLESLSESERHERLEAAFSRLAGMQRDNGGFGLWSADSDEEPWVTPYIVDFLLEAREHGAAVPAELLNKALKRLEDYLQRSAQSALTEGYGEHSRYLNHAVRFYAGYVLARVNRAPLGTLRTLAETPAEQVGAPLPWLHLGIALAKQGDKERGQAMVDRGLKQLYASENGYLGDYGSDLRDWSLAIYLLNKNGLSLEAIPNLAELTNKALEKRTWLSTQERNALFLAALTLAGYEGRTVSGTVRQGDKTLQLKEQRQFSLQPSTSSVRAGVDFQSSSPHPVFARFMTGGYTEAPPAPDNRHFHIVREYYDSEGQALKGRPLKVGELVVVKLQVQSKAEIRDAMVADLLPAGLELESQNLEHSVKLADLRVAGKSVEDWWGERVLQHEEYRDDRYVAALRFGWNESVGLVYLARAVTPGVYHVPAPFAESMYRPEIRGIGTSQAVMTVVD